MNERLQRRCAGLLRVAIAGLCALACAANAGEPAISFDLPAQNDTVVLSGTIVDKPVDVTGSIRVRSIGPKDPKDNTPTAKATAFPLDPGKSPPIPVSRIVIEEKVAPGAQTVELAVTIKGIDRPGIYRGPVELRLDKAGTNDTITKLRITLEVRVAAKPVIEILDKTVSFSVSNCKDTCDFTEFIQPGSTSDSASLAVLNKSLVPTTVELAGEGKGTTVPARTAPFVAAKIVLGPGESGRIPLKFDRTSLSADRYAGTVLVRGTADGWEPVATAQPTASPVVENPVTATVPVQIDVRNAALWPFLIVLLGVFAGRLSKLIGTEAREARAALYFQHEQLSGRIEALQDAADEIHCRQTLEAVWAKALAGDPTTTQVKEGFANVTAKVELFEKLDRLDADVATLPPAQAQAVKRHFATARTAIRNNDFAAATAALNLAEQAIGAPGAAPPHEMTLLAAELTASAREQENVKKNRVARRVANGFGWIVTGSDSTESVAFYALVLKPLLFFALVVALAFYGLWLLYSGPEHSTFGSKGFTEYVGLFLWGFGAQVVAMTFRDIQFARKT